jgi:hypothetical protein
MANLKDIDAGILEVQVYEGVMPGGAPAESAVTLLDMQNDALPTSKQMREHGVQAYGMLLFKSDSPRCPKEPVVWERFEDGLQVTAAGEERHLLDKPFHALCIEMVVHFLKDTANKDPRYAWLAPPKPH